MSKRDYRRLIVEKIQEPVQTLPRWTVIGIGIGMMLFIVLKLLGVI